VCDRDSGRTVAQWEDFVAASTVRSSAVEADPLDPRPSGDLGRAWMYESERTGLGAALESVQSVESSEL